MPLTLTYVWTKISIKLNFISAIRKKNIENFYSEIACVGLF